MKKMTNIWITLMIFIAFGTFSFIRKSVPTKNLDISVVNRKEKPPTPASPEFVLVDASQVWDGTSVASGYAAGSGTLSDPYQISTAAELKYFQSVSNVANYGQDKYYLLTRDIDLNNHEWSPISRAGATNYSYYFAGHFSGKYMDNGVEKSHIIANLKISQTSQFGFGFFHSISGGTVENLIFTGTISTRDRCGTVAYYLKDAILNKITSYVEISINGNATSYTNIGFVGGIAGTTVGTTTLSKCSFAGSITNVNGYFAYCIGGMLGFSNTPATTTINNCNNYANIIGYTSTGGFIGRANKGVTITNSINTGNITACLYGGGFIGEAKTSIVTNCSNYGNVSFIDKVPDDPNKNKKGFAGIIGWCTTSSQISGCHCDENVVITTQGGNSGYLAGYNGAGSSVNCENSTYKILGTEMKPVGYDNNISVTKYFDNQIIGYASIISGTAYTPNDINAAVPEGRTFNGWYTDSALKNGYVNGTALTEALALHGRFALSYATLLQSIKDVDSCTEYAMHSALTKEISFLTDAEQASILAEEFVDHGGYPVTVAIKLAAMLERSNASSGGAGTRLNTSDSDVTPLIVIIISLVSLSFLPLFVVKMKKYK